MGSAAFKPSGSDHDYCRVFKAGRRYRNLSRLRSTLPSTSVPRLHFLTTPGMALNPAEAIRRLCQPATLRGIKQLKLLVHWAAGSGPEDPHRPPADQLHFMQVTATTVIHQNLTPVPQKDGDTLYQGSVRVRSSTDTTVQGYETHGVPTVVTQMLAKLKHTTRDEVNIDPLGTVLRKGIRIVWRRIQAMKSLPKRGVQGTPALEALPQCGNFLRCAAPSKKTSVNTIPQLLRSTRVLLVEVFEGDHTLLLF